MGQDRNEEEEGEMEQAEARQERGSVRTTVELDGPDQERIGQKVERIRTKLSQSPAHGAVFVTSPFEYLAREGLLEDAEEVSFSLEGGEFSDLVFLQSLVKDNRELVTQPQQFGSVMPQTVWVCVEIITDRGYIKVCYQVK